MRRENTNGWGVLLVGWIVEIPVLLLTLGAIVLINWLTPSVISVPFAALTLKKLLLALAGWIISVPLAIFAIQGVISMSQDLMETIRGDRNVEKKDAQE